MKNLLFVYDRMMVGGTTTALLSLLDAIDRKEYNIDLLLYENTGPFLRFIPEHINVLKAAYSQIGLLSSSKKKIILSLLNSSIISAFFSFLKYKGTPKGNLRNILMHYSVRSQVSLSRALEKKYDVAIGFIEGWSDHYVLSNKVVAEKKIVWIHPDYKDSYLIPEVDRACFKKANAIVVVSEKCSINFANVFPQFKEKTYVIENMVSVESLRKRAEEPVEIEKNKIDFCTVCRCDIRVKGLDRVLNSLKRLKREDLLDGVKWHLIGGGKDFDEFSRNVEENGLSENVILYGDITNPIPYLSKMDFFVLASRYEGKPVAVDEALCMGLPCIVTEYASASEQIDNGVNGFVIENNDIAIYSALKQAVGSPERLADMKKNMVAESCHDSYKLGKIYELLGG